jgi:hypothetical protein
VPPNLLSEGSEKLTPRDIDAGFHDSGLVTPRPPPRREDRGSVQEARRANSACCLGGQSWFLVVEEAGPALDRLPCFEQRGGLSGTP